MPAISVLMPVYNTPEKYLRESIESILNQSFKDFEFIIIDDGSDDYIRKIEQEYNDSRIVLIENRENIGLPQSLNKGLDLARGQYIARMDSDDIAVRKRLEIQYEYMQNNPEIFISGGIAQILGTDEFIGVYRNRKQDEIKALLLINNISLVHPTVMIRNSVLQENNLRYNNTEAEDYEFWTRCIEFGGIGFIADVLLQYRVHEGQITTKKINKVIEYTNKIRLNLLNEFKCNFSQSEVIEFMNLREYKVEQLDVLESMLTKMLINVPERYSMKYFKGVLLIQWLIVCKKKGLFGLKAIFFYPITRKLLRFDSFIFIFKYMILDNINWQIVRRRIKGGTNISNS